MTDVFPYPDDDPGTISQMTTGVGRMSTDVSTESSSIGGLLATFDAAWDGLSSDLALTELTTLASYGADTATALADAGEPLGDYAESLIAARTTIDGLRGEYDDEQLAYDQAQADVREERADEPQLLRIILMELQDSHNNAISALYRRYDEAIAALDEAAALAGQGLVDIAGRISPDPESNNPEMVRIGALDRLTFMACPDAPSVVVTDGGVIVTGTDGDDDVTIARVPDTGEYLVTVNGQTYRLTEAQAEGMVIRTGDGSDVVDVDSDVQMGVTVSGGGDDDLIAGGAGQDTISGGDGDDDLFGGTGNDNTTGGGGTDNIGDSVGLFTIPLLAGKYGGRTVQTRSGGGRDTASGGSGNDTIQTGTGDDTVRGGDGEDTIDTGTGDDSADGGDGDDVVYAGEGDDTVEGGADDDYIDAGGGNDDVDAGDGNDVVYGLDGDDTIEGGAGRDYLDGGDGDDGNDNLTGDDGADVIVTGDGDDNVYDVGDSGTDTDGDGEDETDTVYAEPGDDVHVDYDDTDAPRVEYDPDLGNSIEIDPNASPEFRARVESDLALMRSTPEGRQLLASLDASGETVSISESPDEGSSANSTGSDIWIDENGNPAGGEDAEVSYSVNGRWRDPGVLRGAPPSAILYHELVHADDYMNGTLEDGTSSEVDADGNPTGDTENNRELRAVGLSYDPFRDADGDGVDDNVGNEPNPRPYSENSFRDELGIDVRPEY